MADQLGAPPGGEEYWISISDLMSGLMVVFLFIAVAYIMNMAITYEDFKTSLYEDLRTEFEEDLPEWGASLDRETLTLTFSEPDLLFSKGSAYLKPEFRVILDDFFPRYVDVLTRAAYRGEIEEVRIEGHTSSEWATGVTGLPAYVSNMELSQDRTRSVLYYVINLEGVSEHTDWLIRHLTANGLSSSQRVVDGEGLEDRARSRRVEFRVRVDAERRLLSAVEEGDERAGAEAVGE